MKDLINILSLILPFSNEIAGILCESDYKTFSNLYAQCIDPYLLDFRTQKLIPNKKICDDKKFYYKLNYYIKIITDKNDYYTLTIRNKYNIMI